MELREYIEAAGRGESIWISRLREDWNASPASAPLGLRLLLAGGGQRDISLGIPPWENAAERDFVFNYLCANVYNLLSLYGGCGLTLYFDSQNREMSQLLTWLREAFLSESSGYNKCVRTARRLCAVLGAPEFDIYFAPLGDYSPAAETREAGGSLAPVLHAAIEKAKQGSRLGIDVGGTDIKLAASYKGEPAAFKELDWNPERFQTAEEIIEPIVLLARLMGLRLEEKRRDVSLGLDRAMEKDCPLEDIARLVEKAESHTAAEGFDSIGLSFPDVVINDRICGGETPKTRGIREAPQAGYEAELARLGGLTLRLKKLCKPDGAVRCINDGNMAAFTAAVELCAGGNEKDIRQGVLAHSLGTDLGTGWVRGDGRIPEMPLELYDLLLDMGSFPAKALPPEDLRSVVNENSAMAGLRRYLGQAAVFRLVWDMKPELLEGFVSEEKGVLRIKTEPQDMRKPCLQHLMELAGEGVPEAAEAFRHIGRSLAQVTAELEYLAPTGTRRRFLFGRFVGSRDCFELIAQGFHMILPEYELRSADKKLAYSPLMAQLSHTGGGAVARLGQAVGALYYSLC